MASIIIPGRPLPEIDSPIVFLAGPIKGASRKWRSLAIEYLFELDENIMIASPDNRIKLTLQQFIVSGNGPTFPRNRLWERHIMDIAGRQKGSILFWLCEEVKHSCRKPFGSMTRGEFSEWMTRTKYDQSVRFCVGTDGLFPGIDLMLCDLSDMLPGNEVFRTLEATCKEALRLANR